MRQSFFSGRSFRPSIEFLERRLLFAAPDPNFKLVWSDEFNGTRLNTSNWSIGLPWTGDNGTNRHHDSNYASYITDDNVTVSGGVLNLLTQRQDVAGYHYTEGLITTAQSFRMTYGYVEIRAQAPAEAGPGLWPTFWMLGDSWPPEVDVGEWFTSTNRFHQGLATGSAAAVHWNDVNTYTPLPTGFHTYGMEWAPGYQIFNVDGHVTHTVRGDFVPNSPMYFLLNSGVDAIHPPTSATQFPNAFSVDYVRVYKRSPAASLSNPSFEGGALGPWIGQHNASVTSDSPYDGAYALRTQGAGSSASQTLSGLAPNATYVLTAAARVADASNAAQIGVNGTGGIDGSAAITSTTYTPTAVTFTTGPATTSATVYAMQSAGAGYAWFDHFAVRRARMIDNGNFETGSPGAWASAGAVAVVPGGRRGRYSLAESGAGASASQTIYGLAPNSTYEITGWANTTPGDAATFTVKDFGGSDISANVSSTRYGKATLLFTTGSSASSVTIVCSHDAGSGSARFDDLALTGPFPLKISAASAQTALAGRTKRVRFTLSGVLPGFLVTFVATSSDETVLPAAALTVGRRGARRTLSIAVPAGSAGQTVITLTASDGTGRRITTSFALTITSRPQRRGNTARGASVIHSENISGTSNSQ